MLKVTGPESTNLCKYDQICAGLKSGIDGAIRGFKLFGTLKVITEDWVLLLVDAKNDFKYINQVEMIWKVRHL